VGFSVGTRPDCIDAEKVALLESYTDRFDVDLEMGMESIYDETLNQINRGCSHGEFVEAVKLLENSKLDLCVHTIFGFPWETKEMMHGYIHEINRFPQIKLLNFIIYILFEGSIMGVKYKKQPFKTLYFRRIYRFACELIPLFVLIL